MEETKLFDDLTWEDVVIEHGRVKSIREFAVEDIRHRSLRTICSRLKIKGVKNTSKETMLEKIVSVRKLKERYGRINDDAEQFLTPTRKEPQCPYRLLNVLFSDMFSEGLAQLGDVADRFQLDSGKASNNQLFWEGVQEAFTSNSDLFDNLHFEDEVLSTLHHLNLKKIVHHDWKKLRAMWKNLNAEYKTVLGRYTMSGTHTSDFFEFCNGRHDVYYLRKHLEAKPNLNATVAADLPEEARISSTGRPPSRLSSASSTATTKRKVDKSEVIDLLHDMQADRKDKKTREDLWREKEELRLEKEELRLEREEARKVSEEERKVNEEERKVREAERQEEEYLYSQWERVGLHIQQLSAALSRETNELLKHEIQCDIMALINRKKMLANKLNLH